MNKERYLNDQDRKDFLELITPFMERIRLASEGKGRLTNKGQVKEYKTIFDKYIKDPKSEDLNIGCNNCMGLSYKQTIGKYEREFKAEIGKEIESNLKKKPNAIKSGEFMTFPKIEPITNKQAKELLCSFTDNMDLNQLKWGEFKKYCTSKGISVKGKTRKELEQELKEL